jgi:hypothetical protein
MAQALVSPPAGLHVPLGPQAAELGAGGQQPVHQRPDAAVAGVPGRRAQIGHRMARHRMARHRPARHRLIRHHLTQHRLAPRRPAAGGARSRSSWSARSWLLDKSTRLLTV